MGTLRLKPWALSKEVPTAAGLRGGAARQRSAWRSPWEQDRYRCVLRPCYPTPRCPCSPSRGQRLRRERGGQLLERPRAGAPGGTQLGHSSREELPTQNSPTESSPRAHQTVQVFLLLPRSSREGSPGRWPLPQKARRGVLRPSFPSSRPPTSQPPGTGWVPSKSSGFPLPAATLLPAFIPVLSLEKGTARRSRRLPLFPLDRWTELMASAVPANGCNQIGQEPPALVLRGPAGTQK